VLVDGKQLVRCKCGVATCQGWLELSDMSGAGGGGGAAAAVSEALLPRLS
jgi:hypothetical protein